MIMSLLGFIIIECMKLLHVQIVHDYHFVKLKKKPDSNIGSTEIGVP